MPKEHYAISQKPINLKRNLNVIHADLEINSKNLIEVGMNLGIWLYAIFT